MAAISLASAISFATPVAKFELACVDPNNTNIFRTVYSTEEKSLLLANPLGNLLVVDEIKDSGTDTIILTAKSDQGGEVLAIKNTGDATFSISLDNQKSSTYNMKCYSSVQEMNLSFLKN